MTKSRSVHATRIGASKLRQTTSLYEADRRWGPPSAEAIAERDKVMATAHSSYTAEHFGDPRPGRSMLDKKRQQQRVED